MSLVQGKLHLPKHAFNNHRNQETSRFRKFCSQHHRISRNGSCLPVRPCPVPVQASGDCHRLWPACRLRIAEFRHWQQGDFLFSADHVVWRCLPDDNDSPIHCRQPVSKPDMRPGAINAATICRQPCNGRCLGQTHQRIMCRVPAFQSRFLKALPHSRTTADPDNSVVATWWDYGYASMFFNDLPTFMMAEHRQHPNPFCGTGLS